MPVAYGLQQAINGLPLAAIYALLAAAYSLVYGLVGRINLAFGELAAAGGYAATFGVLLAAGYAPAAMLALALLLAVSTASAFGVASGRAGLRARCIGRAASRRWSRPSAFRCSCRNSCA